METLPVAPKKLTWPKAAGVLGRIFGNVVGQQDGLGVEPGKRRPGPVIAAARHELPGEDGRRVLFDRAAGQIHDGQPESDRRPPLPQGIEEGESLLIG